MKVRSLPAVIYGILLVLATPALAEDPALAEEVVIDGGEIIDFGTEGEDGGSDLNALPPELQERAQELISTLPKEDSFADFPEGEGGGSDLNALPPELQEHVQELVNEISSRSRILSVQ